VLERVQSWKQFQVDFFLCQCDKLQIHIYHTVAHLLSLSAVIFGYSGKILGRFAQVRRLVDGSWKSHPSLLPPSLSYQSRTIVPSRSDIYMAIAGAPTPPAGVCAPRPELKPPHYHGLEGCGRSGGRLGRQAGALWTRRLPENPFCEYWR